MTLTEIYQTYFWVIILVFGFVAVIVLAAWFHKLKTLIEAVQFTLGWGWSIGVWLWPLILLAIGLAMPSFHQSVKLPLPDSVKGGLLLMVVLGCAAVISSILTNYGTNSRTKLQI